MTKKEIVSAIRAANPTAGVYGLWVDYDIEHGKERYIPWNYFQKLCREVDKSKRALLHD